jgi:hypothetical protein
MEGFTVASAKHTYINVQSKAVTWVKDKVETRRMLRRNRRNRKMPCRKPRFNNRHTNKERLAPSTKSRWQLKLRILNRLARLFPIKYVVVEDVQTSTKNGRVKAQSFQMVMQGKNWFYGKVREQAILLIVKGWETSDRRNLLGLKKIKNKMSTNWSTHCVDSFALCTFAVGGVFCNNKKVHVVSPSKKHYRNLHVQNFSKGGKRRDYGSTRSLGFTRVSIVRHPKWGTCLVGGTSNARVSLHRLDGKRLTQSAKAEDIVFKAFNSFIFMEVANSSTV